MQLTFRPDRIEDPLLAGLAQDAAGNLHVCRPPRSGLSPPRDEITRLAGYEGSVQSAAFSADRARVVTAGDNGTDRPWDAASGAENLCAHGDSGLVCADWHGPSVVLGDRLDRLTSFGVVA